MKLFDPDPSIRWLFWMTHPDDEISICAWIKRLTDAKAPVYMAWTHSTPAREREARAVAARLGVAETRLHFFEAPDAEVIHNLDMLMPKFRSWIQHVNPDRICCGAFEQGHLDHDATNLLVNLNFNGPVLEIPFYHAYLSSIQQFNRFSDPHGQEILHLSQSEQKFKKNIAKCFPTQNIWSLLLWHEAYQVVKLRKIELAKSERMRLQTHRDFLTPNHPPRLCKRIAASPNWARWVEQVKPFLERQEERAMNIR
ncbi:MAG: PIG-L family deacetylase [Armatimonadetes bacterium]|nr:PIG-L family deacetylase [Armatimonadota bacterium]